jgi:transposase-like protein
MNAENSTADEDARAVALELLREGEATVSDAARVAGVDRQLVHYWAKAAGKAGGV